MALTVDDIFRLDRSKKIMILIGITVLLGFAYYSMLFKASWESYQKDQSKLMELQRKKTEQELIARNLPKFRAQVEKLDIDLKRALAQLPNKKEIPSLLTNISNMGREAGLKFLLFRPKGEKLKEFYAEVPVEITVTGSYHQVATFFDKVGRLPRIVKIFDINIDEPREEEEGIELTTSCVATTYRFVEGASEGSEDEQT